MPDISTAEVARMHADNSARMNSFDEKLEKSRDKLEEVLQIVGRIDERTKKYEGQIEDQAKRIEKHQKDIEDLSKSVNKGKGIGSAVAGFLGLLETIHWIFSSHK